MSTPDDSHADVIALRATPPGGHPMASVQGSLALDLTPRTAPPRPRLRSTQALDLVAVEQAARGHVDAFVGRYLQAVVEIAAGDRPLSQVLRHTVPDIYSELGERVRTVSAAAGLSPGQARGPNPARPVVVGVTDRADPRRRGRGQRTRALRPPLPGGRRTVRDRAGPLAVRGPGLGLTGLGQPPARVVVARRPTGGAVAALELLAGAAGAQRVAPDAGERVVVPAASARTSASPSSEGAL